MWRNVVRTQEKQGASRLSQTFCMPSILASFNSRASQSTYESHSSVDFYFLFFKFCFPHVRPSDKIHFWFIWALSTCSDQLRPSWWRGHQILGGMVEFLFDPCSVSKSMKSCKLHKRQKLPTDLVFVRANNVVSQRRTKTHKGEDSLSHLRLHRDENTMPAPLSWLRRPAEDTESLWSCSSSDCSQASPLWDSHTALRPTDSCRVGGSDHTHGTSLTHCCHQYAVCVTPSFPALGLRM